MSRSLPRPSEMSVCSAGRLSVSSAATIFHWFLHHFTDITNMEAETESKQNGNLSVSSAPDKLRYHRISSLHY